MPFNTPLTRETLGPLGSAVSKPCAFCTVMTSPELGMAKMLRCRVRYFSDGAVIGGKDFVNEVFNASRERFSEKRKDGARRLRGNAKAVAGVLWCVRDLRVDVG